jgi:hypothetical protein
LISAALLAVPGASAYFLGGAIVYTRQAKSLLLAMGDGVPSEFRPVTEPHALLLARRAQVQFAATWGLGETGAAGPSDCAINVTHQRNEWYEVSGIIGADDWKKLEELANKISDYDHTLVVLRSPGASAAGVAMGDLIHKTGMSTLVADNETCASVCALIWLGGARRFLYPNSHIGFHGVFNAAGEVDHDAGMANAMMGVYLGHLGFSYAAAAWMLSPPVRSMHWLREAEAKKFGIRCESAASVASSAPAPTATPTPAPAANATLPNGWKLSK